MKPLISEPLSEPGALAQAFLPLRLEAFEDAKLSVTGWSMGFLLGPAAQVRVRRLQGMPTIGDVVLVRHGNGLILHRVIARDRRRGLVVTKGDTCPRADAPVPLADILGIMTGIVEHPRVRIPLRMRFPWAILIAANSRMQDRFQRAFPGVMVRWDVFRFMFRALERTERWIS